MTTTEDISALRPHMRPQDQLLRQTDLHCDEGTSDKVYHACLVKRVNQPITEDSYEILVAYGRRYGTMNTGSKGKSLSLHNLNKTFDKIVREKVGKGYRILSEALPAGSPGAPTHVRSDLSPVRQASVTPPQPRAMLLDRLDDVEELGRLIDSGEWAVQLKVDGVRLQVEIAGGWADGSARHMVGYNRRGAEVAIPDAVKAGLEGFPVGAVLDGELTSDGSSVFHIFDVVDEGLGFGERMDCLAHAIRGVSTVAMSNSLKLANLRRKMVEPYTMRDFRAMINPAINDAVRFVAPFTCVPGDSIHLLQMARLVRDEGLEGVVLKKLDGAYTVGRGHGLAFKHKFVQSATCLVNRVNAGRSVELTMLSAGGPYIVVGNCTIPANYDMPTQGQIVEVRYLYANGRPQGPAKLYQPVYLGERHDVLPDCTSELKFRSST